MELLSLSKQQRARRPAQLRLELHVDRSRCMSRYVTPAELRSGLESLKIDVTEQDLEVIFATADVDGDGRARHSRDFQPAALWTPRTVHE